MSIALLPDFPITASGPLSTTCRTAGLHSFRALAAHVARLRYGRPAAPGDWAAVLMEGRGTCSSKHALIAATAREHGRTDVELVLGVFEMSEATTPGVGAALAYHGLTSVPEAHCYLRHADERIDITGLPAGSASPFAALLSEVLVAPADLAAQKVSHHQAALESWAAARGLDPQGLWVAREACIRALSTHAAEPVAAGDVRPRILPE